MLIKPTSLFSNIKVMPELISENAIILFQMSISYLLQTLKRTLPLNRTIFESSISFFLHPEVMDCIKFL